VSRLAGAGLIVLGLAQMAGDLLGALPIEGLAAATAASPAPRVFTAIRGLEPYSTRFFLEWSEGDGTRRSLALTPEVYARLQGPYNRRNVYGAALAGGQVLVADPRLRPLFQSVAAHALCGEAPLLRELGLEPMSGRARMRIRYEPRPGAALAGAPRVVPVPCV
jgi:hypothetical protein